MPGVVAVDRLRKFVGDISRLCLDARRVQLRFALETGRRVVEEEQDGAMRAAYGKQLIPQLSKALTEKCGPGFSKSNLLKMRRFYLLNQKKSVTTQLDWICSTAATSCAWRNNSRPPKTLRSPLLFLSLKLI